MFRCAPVPACRAATKCNLTRHAHAWFTSFWRSSSTISSSKPRSQVSGGAMGRSQWAGTSPAPRRSTRDGTLQLADTGERSLICPVSVWPVGARSCSLPVPSDPLKGCNPRVKSEVGDERHPLSATIPPSWQGGGSLGCEVSPAIGETLSRDGKQSRRGRADAASRTQTAAPGQQSRRARSQPGEFECVANPGVGCAYPFGPCRASWPSERNRRIGSSASGAKPNLS